MRALPNCILLKTLYREKISSHKLKADGLLVKYIHQFQGLEILWREIDKYVEPEDMLVTQMAEQV